MKVPFTWRPTGWFMVGWSHDFPVGSVKPLQYFGGHQVAYRTEDGELHMLDAHCPHLGAHLGHGGKVKDDCIVCPYHGWGYGPDGVNKFIPYEDRPNVSHSLKVWPLVEQHGCVFVWHDPAGGSAALGAPRPLHGSGRTCRVIRSTTTDRGRRCRSSTRASRCTLRSRSRTGPTRSTSSTCTAPP